MPREMITANKIKSPHPLRLGARVRAGVIMFDHDLRYTILVKSRKNGNWSFPKGRSKRDEPPFQSATRELQEETGIRLNELHILKNQFLSLSNKKGKICEIYYIGRLKPSITNLKKYTKPRNEIYEAKWFKISRALTLKDFKYDRKQCFFRALQIFRILKKNEKK